MTARVRRGRSEASRLRRALGPEHLRSLGLFWALTALLALSAAMIAVGFRYLLQTVTTLFFVVIPSNLPALGNTVIIVLPAVGGLLVGLLTLAFGPEMRGVGIPDVMASLEVARGKFRSRAVGVKALASALSVGSGGSAGREGPIVYISSVVGSLAAQASRLTSYQRRILIACGATAGVSAAFNTPIAAVIFSLELVLREFRTRSFIPLVISSVLGTLISREMLRLIGVEQAFIISVPMYSLVSIWEIALYLPLGILCGAVAVLFIKAMGTVETAFRRASRTKSPSLLVSPPSAVQVAAKPAVGGLLVGCLGFLILEATGDTYVLGIGYDVIDTLFHQGLPLFLIGALIFLKMFASVFTIGSGGSGGVFASLLYIGAMTGGFFGGLVHLGLPTQTAGYEAYAIVGMAAVFAGATRATLTSILLIFEMTGNYAIILPLMFACVISDGVSVLLSKDTIFTLNLTRRGVLIEHDLTVDVIKTRTAAEVMRTNIPPLPPDGYVSDACPVIQEVRSPAYPVISKDGAFIGLIGRDELMDALIAGQMPHPLQFLVRHPDVVVYPNETLDQVLSAMNRENTNYLAVVDPKDRRVLLGIITRNDLLKLYRPEPGEG